MTLRDLSKRQLYFLNRRAGKERKVFEKSWAYTNAPLPMTKSETQIWMTAYDKGLKAGLSLCPTKEEK